MKRFECHINGDKDGIKCTFECVLFAWHGTAHTHTLQNERLEFLFYWINRLIKRHNNMIWNIVCYMNFLQNSLDRMALSNNYMKFGPWFRPSTWLWFSTTTEINAMKKSTLFKQCLHTTLSILALRKYFSRQNAEMRCLLKYASVLHVK